MNPNPTPTTAPPVVFLGSIEWNFLWQVLQEVATNYAERGHRVVFVEPLPHRNPRFHEIKRVLRRLGGRRGGIVKNPLHPRITVVSPIALPETSPTFVRMNSRVFVPRLARTIRNIIGEDVRPIIYCWFPLMGSVDLVRELNPSVNIYSCADNFDGHRDAPPTMRSAERLLVQNADGVIVTSRFLQDKIAPFRPDVTLRQLGCDTSLFGRADTGIVKSVRTLAFFGAIGDRLDMDILSALARARFKIRLIGRIQGVDLTSLGSALECVPPVPHEELAVHLRDADCLILPYRLTTWGLGIRPAKLSECLATGKPIVGTRLPDLLGLEPLVYTAADSATFVDLVTRVPDLERDGSARLARISYAEAHSTEAAFEQEYRWVTDLTKNGSRGVA